MAGPDFLLRAATVADADGAGSVHYASWVETYAGLASQDFWDGASRQRSIDIWQHLLEGGLDATVAEVDGAIVGVAVAGQSHERDGHPPARARELSNLYVLAAHHGTGIGQALLDGVVPPGTQAELWVARGNPRAVRFYERNGFVADGATTDGSGFGGIAAIRMLR
jgi:GNAT superfamily N-acetyltransferase